MMQKAFMIKEICAKLEKLGFKDMNCYTDNIYDGIRFRMSRKVMNKDAQPENIKFEMFATNDLINEKSVDEVVDIVIDKWNEEVKKVKGAEGLPQASFERTKAEKNVKYTLP